MTTHGKARNSLWLTGLTLVLAAGAGCDRQDAASKAIETAERRIAVLTGAGSAVNPFADGRRKDLSEIAGTVKPFLESKLAGQARAANLIAAQAIASAAELDLADAEIAERAAVGKNQSIREELETWSTHSARAKSEESYDPAPQVAELNAQIAEVDTAIAAKAAERTTLEKQIAAMNKDADAKVASAKQQRDQAAELQRQVQGGTATQGLTLIENATKIRRVADTLDTEASGLRAQVKMLQPQVDQLNRDAASLQRKKESLTQAKAGLGERAELARNSAGEARKIASTAAARIDAIVAELKSLRNDSFIPADEKAIRGFGESAAMSSKAITLASGPDASHAKLSNALYQQSLGAAYLAKARELHAAASIMELIGSASPALANGEQFVAAGKQFRTDADAAVEKVKDAFSKAWAVYESAKDAGGAGELFKARMDSATTTLKMLAGEKPAAPEPAPAAAAADTGKPAAPSAPAAALTQEAAEAAGKAFMDSWHDAMRKRDAGAVAELMNTTPANRKTVAEIQALGLKMIELNEACHAKFGKTLGEMSASANPAIAMQLGMFAKFGESQKAELDRTSADYVYSIVDQNKIQAVLKKPEPEDSPVTLVSVGGRWLSELNEALAALLPNMQGMAKPATDLVNSLTEDVKSGKVADERQFLTQLTMKLASLQGRMPKPAGAPSPDPNK